MIGKIKTIIEFAPKKRLIKIEVNGVTAKTFVVDGNSNSKKWKELKVDDCLKGLEWFDEHSKIIDADSPIQLLV
jgi:hypothetical protein